MKLIFLLLGISFCFQTKLEVLEFNKKVNINVDEPSDIVYHEKDSTFYVVSDKGYLAQINAKGKRLRKTKYDGTDFEAVIIEGDYIITVDESHRKVHYFDMETFKHKKKIKLEYNGGRNKGFESICQSFDKKGYYLITEANPILIRQYNDFQLVNETKFKGSTDVSSATMYNDKLWLVSDEDHKIMVLNESFEIIKEWKIPINNPEGITFTENQMVIVSDDHEKMYFFDIPKP